MSGLLHVKVFHVLLVLCSVGVDDVYTWMNGRTDGDAGDNNDDSNNGNIELCRVHRLSLWFMLTCAMTCLVFS